MADYIGNTIALISQKDIRYVGILEDINGQESTISLKDVRVFGTEGRVSDPARIVYPSTEVYTRMMLRGADVKDLNILPMDINLVKPEPLPFAPTGYNSFPGATAPQVAPQASPQSAPLVSSQATEAAAPAAVSATAAPAEEPKEASRAASPENKIPAKQQQRKRDQKRPQPVSNDELREDFDFESNNAKFTKEEAGAAEKEAGSYNKKSSFFDTISSSTEPGKTEGMRWADEKNLNYDTFGQTSVFRGRGRGRGRGGRGGRGRGGRGGRGGYNNKQPEWA